MRMISLTVLFLFLTTALATAEPSRVTERAAFEDIVIGRELTMIGVRLTVSADGTIVGTAFGRDVTGQWQWQDGYFCRDLYHGSEDLGPNCQMVTYDGKRIQFTSDRGAGLSAKLKVR